MLSRCFVRHRCVTTSVLLLFRSDRTPWRVRSSTFQSNRRSPAPFRRLSVLLLFGPPGRPYFFKAIGLFSRHFDDFPFFISFEAIGRPGAPVHLLVQSNRFRSFTIRSNRAPWRARSSTFKAFGVENSNRSSTIRSNQRA